jgi:hypothetical protein
MRASFAAPQCGQDFASAKTRFPQFGHLVFNIPRTRFGFDQAAAYHIGRGSLRTNASGANALVLLRAPRIGPRIGHMTVSARRFTASLCLCWTAWCGSYDSNAWPLAFGMTPSEVSLALGVPLASITGRAGSDIKLADGWITIPGRFPIEGTIALQFRRGHLTGWKKNWGLLKPWVIY